MMPPAELLLLTLTLLTPPASTKPIRRSLTHLRTTCKTTTSLHPTDTSLAISALLSSHSITTAPQTLLGQRHWSGVSENVWAYIANDSPCPQTLLSQSDVRMLFGSLNLDCGDMGGVAYWVHGEEGEGRRERIEVGLVQGMAGERRRWEGREASVGKNQLACER